MLIYDRGGNQVLYQQIVKERSKIEEEIENIQCKLEKLAYKKYLSVRLKGIEKEKRAIDFYLKHHDENTYLKEQELLENPEFQKLI